MLNQKRVRGEERLQRTGKWDETKDVTQKERAINGESCQKLQTRREGRVTRESD